MHAIVDADIDIDPVQLDMRINDVYWVYVYAKDRVY